MPTSTSANTITPRGRSPQHGYDGAEKQHQHQHQQYQQQYQQQQYQQQMAHLSPKWSCERCQSKTSEKVTRFDLPLIAVARAFDATLGFATVVCVQTAADAGWWPWEHKVLFVLCWLQFFWNLLHCAASALGYHFWPSPRRAAGLPPISVTIGNRLVASFGGPGEDDGERRRRYRRLRFSLVDLLLALPSLGFLVYSAHIMSPWWGSRYVGLRSPAVGLIASLISFQLFTAILQLFQFFEAKVVGVQITMQDIYERENAYGRLYL
ncbi:hypothetical protein F5B17DRAFT_389942 [Nemania serpens]|nr:hypothetical protein F5B17DRAFT_389942 [Nemania serpens]